MKETQVFGRLRHGRCSETLALLIEAMSTKSAKPESEKAGGKTPGTVAVEAHRPAMNKLSAPERRRLRQRAAELLYGREALATGR